MSIEVDAKTLAAAVKGLGLNVPIYHARKVRGGVEITTRHGVQVWKPQSRRPGTGKPVKRKRRSVSVSNPTLGGAKSGKGETS